MAVTIMSWAKLAVAAGIDLAGHEVAADGLERCRPTAPPDPVALPQRLEPLVVADRVAVVLGHVVPQVDPEALEFETRCARRRRRSGSRPGTGELDVGTRRIAVREAAATAERGIRATAGVPHWRQATIIQP